MNSTTVDIVIPAYGQQEKLDRCLHHAAQQAKHTVTLTVFDDCSKEKITAPAGLSIVTYRAKERGGFASACNRGASKGKGDYILFLNSDCYLDEGAIDHLADVLDRDGTIGVVGALLRFDDKSTDPRRPAGKVQHAGIAFDLSATPYHVFAGWSLSNPRVAKYREMGAVTGACMLVRRPLWKLLGGFSEVYGLGTFEDIELCLRARKLGQAVAFQPLATAIHDVGASALATGTGFPVAENQQIYYQRCKPILFWDEWQYL